MALKKISSGTTKTTSLPKKVDFMGIPFVPKQATVGGVVFKPEGEVPVSEEKEARQMARTSNRAMNLTDLFERTQPFVRENTVTGKYIKGIPMLKDTGIAAGITGLEASVRGKMGLFKDSGDSVGFDDVAGFNSMADSFVTTLARSAGEDRVSDQDARRFKSSLMSFMKSEGENKILSDALMRDFQTKTPGQIMSERTGNPSYLKKEQAMAKAGITPKTAAQALGQNPDYSSKMQAIDKSTSVSSKKGKLSSGIDFEVL